MTRAKLAALPRPARLLQRLIGASNRFFDWLYHSEYNPLYRSGTLIVGLFFILLITGLYLLLFYQVTAPYASLRNIEQQVWLGSWMRAVHRYATDLAMVALVFHVMQMVAEGRTWGPRVIAWLSGLVLLGALCLSAWTGYVMIWDRHGQLLALAGADLLRVFPFLRAALGQAFDGTTPLLSSFFFMNLFLHVAVPLGMVAGIWIHTVRLARIAWFPKWAIFWGCLATVGLVAWVWPSPLLPEADLFSLIGRTQVDIFYGFWIQILQILSAPAALIFFAILCVLGLVVPWWIRPADLAPFSPSSVDKELCLGCSQCSRDCPYEAITMMPREGKVPLYSLVNPTLCVSCAICSASCDDYAIGPKDRSAKDLVSKTEEQLALLPVEQRRDRIALFVCACNGDAYERAQQFRNSKQNLAVVLVDCCGTLHSNVIESTLETFASVAIWGCPERNCLNRDGVSLLKQRVYEFRHPTPRRKVDRRRINLLSLAAWESDKFFARLNQSSAVPQDGGLQSSGRPGALNFGLRRLAASLILVFGVAALSRFPFGQEVQHGLLRIAFHIPGKTKEECRPLTEQERKSGPAHMQLKEICQTRSIDYRFSLSVNGQSVLDRPISAAGARGDRAVYVHEDVRIPVGQSQVSLELVPVDESLRQQFSLKFGQAVKIDKGRIAVVAYDPASMRLWLKTSI